MLKKKSTDDTNDVIDSSVDGGAAVIIVTSLTCVFSAMTCQNVRQTEGQDFIRFSKLNNCFFFELFSHEPILTHLQQNILKKCNVVHFFCFFFYSSFVI